jgi:ATPase family protein associated with various cellular activities (AAA)
MAVVAQSEQSKLETRIRQSLAQLGGGAFKDEDIIFEGKKLIIPKQMTLQETVDFIEKRIADEEKLTLYERTFNYRPMDGAYCTWKALMDHFGSVSHRSQTVKTMFGPKKAPPAMIDIPIGPGLIEQVPWGNFEVPFLPGLELELGSVENEEYGQLFHITGKGPKKYRFEVEGIFKLISIQLSEHSIYRGQAVTGKETPDFLDLSGVDPAKVTYSDEVTAQLASNIWSLLNYSDEHRAQGLPLKRAVLMHGQYGTGKTLAAMLTAQESVRNGWTFLYARPGKDDLNFVMQTARLYQPAVVFFEDMDLIADPNDAEGDDITELLDVFDGITAKGTEIICILTTNHVEKIHKGMTRPGRLDAIIEIGALDAEGVERLVRSVVPEDQLDPQIDFAPIIEAMSDPETGELDFMPAFVREACDRTRRYAITRRKGQIEGIILTSEDFVHAAYGLRAHLDLMKGAKDIIEREPLGSVMRKAVNEEARVAAEEAVRENLSPQFLVPKE